MNKVKQIAEGYKNHFIPKDSLKDLIEQTSQSRLVICNLCEENSNNKKDYNSIRPDMHCTNCGCTLLIKTKCLTCECPLKKWLAQSLPDNENT
jgi:hydrogenase maturation factor HypF (carbamoyltransferase family)